MDRHEKARKHLKKLGFGTKSFSNLVLVAEALERGVEVGVSRSGRRIALRKESRNRYWKAGASNLNSKLAIRMTHRKDVCSRFLRAYLPNIPENCVFTGAEIERAWSWAEPMESLVLKPYNGAFGRDVHVGIQSRDEFDAAFGAIAARYGQVLVEEFHEGIEHRCLVVENRLVAVTRRRPASVLGNGSSNIEQLVTLKNKGRGRVHAALVLDSKSLGALAKAGYTPESVPLADERVYLRGTSNISTGGDAIDATDEITGAERDIIESAARAIPDLRMAGFDVLLPPRDNPAQSPPMIIEINAGPMISMHHFPAEGQPRDVSKVILETMFPKLTHLKASEPSPWLAGKTSSR